MTTLTLNELSQRARERLERELPPGPGRPGNPPESIFRRLQPEPRKGPAEWWRRANRASVAAEPLIEPS